MKSAAHLRTLAIAVAIALAAVVSLLTMLQAPEETTRGSADSSEPRGRRAAILTLQALGFAAETWFEPPARLPRGRHLVLLASAPDASEDEPEPERDDEPGKSADEEEPSDDESQAEARERDPLRLARERGLGAPRHYLAFAEQGGTLLVPWSSAMRTFLVEDLGLDSVGDLAVGATELGATRARLESAELALEWNAPAFTTTSGAPSGLAPLLVAASGEVLAFELALGEGLLVLVASDRFLDNEAIDKADHGVLLVRLAERFAAGGRVLFDEDALGRGRAGGPLDLAFGPGHRALTLQLLLALLFFVWRFAWVREFPRDPEPLEQLSPLERARAFAGLFVRARKLDVLAELLRANAVRRLAALLRVRAAPLAEGRIAPEELQRELARLSHEAPGRFELERWRDALAPRAVGSLAELESLDRTLRELESTLIHGARAPRAPTP